MPASLSRRGFLYAAASAPLALAGADVPRPIRHAAGSKLKLALNAYTFSPLLLENQKDASKGMTLNDVVDFCVAENLEAIDPTGYFFPGYPEVPTDKFLNDFKRRTFQLGLDICGTGVRNNFAAPDKASRAKDVKLIKNWIEAAARLGAPVLRVFAGAMPTGYAWDDVAHWMADELRICAEYGEKYGVLVGVQNHGDSLRTADEILKLLKLVDSTWLGVVVDTGWFVSADPYDDIARVAPYAVNWQVKEQMDGKTRKIKTDVGRIVKIVRASGYRGYLPIETLPLKGVVYDPKARAGELLAELRTALA